MIYGIANYVLKKFYLFVQSKLILMINNTGYSNINTNLLNLLSQINNLTDNDNSEDDNLPNCNTKISVISLII